MEELLAELTHLARRSPEISQRSGVSVRVTVANAEVLEAAALRRAVRLGESVAAPRVSDLGAVIASTVGKIELGVGRRRGARGAGRRAADHEGALHDVRPAGRHRRARRRRRSRSRTGSSSRPARPCRRASTSRWMREIPGCTRRSGGSARSTSPTGPRSRRSSRRRSSSCSRASTSSRRINKDRAGGATRLPAMTARRPGDRLQSGSGHLGAGPGPISGRDPLLARAARYARWDGTQSIPALDADEILDALADDVMAEGDLGEALRRLMERGWRGRDATRLTCPASASCASGCGASATRSRSATTSPTSSPTSAPSSRRSSPMSGPGSSAGSTRRPTRRRRTAAVGGVRRRAPEDAPRRRRPAPRPAEIAAARRRQADPVARGVRLHGAGRARAVPGADRPASAADARPLRRRPVTGDPGDDAHPSGVPARWARRGPTRRRATSGRVRATD